VGVLQWSAVCCAIAITEALRRRNIQYILNFDTSQTN
jgi:hypothetical protein